MKGVKEIIGLMVSVFFLFTNSFAQGGISFEFDYAQFKNDSTSNLIEFYLYVDKSSLVPEGNSDKIGLVVGIDIIDTVSNEKIVSKGYQFDDEYAKGDLSNRSIVSVVNFAIPYGAYKLELTAVDKHDTTNAKTISDSLMVSSLIDKSLNVSGIELASNIISGSDRAGSSFYKNGLEVIPNPHAIYDDSPVMFYYSELYFNNLPASDKVVLKRNIIDKNGMLVNHKTKVIKSFDNDLVDADVINISDLNSGNYFLYLTVFDSSSYLYDQTFKSFYIYNPVDTSGLNDYKEDFVSSVFSDMSAEECEREFQAIKYFLSKPQRDNYESLAALDAKKKFLFTFWNVRDNDPATPENEQRIEILQRAEYASQQFKYLKRDGIDTDRGRVYIVYGAPDEIDRFDYEIDTKPYEIWKYHSIEGGVKFIFGDLTGFNNYILIHSTKRGELADEDWLERLYEVY